MSDEIEDLLRAARPEPAAGLRARVLAATAQIDPVSPWWARARTWAAAALILFSVEMLVVHTRDRAPVTPAPAVVHVDEALLPHPALAWMVVPMPESRNAPTPLSELKEMYP